MVEQIIQNYDLITASLPGLAVLLSAAGAFSLPIIQILVKNRKFWELLTVVVTGSVMILTYRLLFAVANVGKPLVYTFGGWPPPVGIVYEVDMFGALLGVVVSSIMFLVAIYSIKYLEFDDGVQWYYTLFMGLEAGMLGCIYTGDFFNLFVMIEVTAVSAYALVAFRRYDRIAIEAAMKYAIFGALATTMYFTAVIFAYGSLGTLNMADMALKLGKVEVPVTGLPFGIVHYGMALFVVFALWSFTFKAALFPNHFWLPDAHAAAPSSISALLSGLVVKVGVYAIARFLYTIFSASEAIASVRRIALLAVFVMGVFSAFLGAILMFIQRDIKRLIAYSTILNIGYIAIGFGLGSAFGALAATYHIVNHAVAKALLFMAAGAYIHYAGTRDIEKLSGIGRAMPITTLAFIIGAFSLAGIPPLNAFMSKFLLYGALLATGILPLVAVVVIPSIIAFLAYLKLVYTIFVKPLPKEYAEKKIKDHPLLTGPVVVLAIACILLGVGAPYVINNYIWPATKALMDWQSYTQAMLQIAQKLP